MQRRNRPNIRLTAGTLATTAAVAACVVMLVGQGRHPVSGRQIAQVMGYEGAAWLERPERVAEEAPAKAIKALNIRSGETVADIGAGSGYYSVLLADAVGRTGRVYATDIQPEMLGLIRQKIDARLVRNIEPVLGTAIATGLPDGAIDMALMVDVYHELEQPQVFLRSVKRALKPDGRLVLIEFRKEDRRVPIRDEHKMSVREARMELEAEGFRLERASDVLPWQHILVFTRSVGP